MKYKLFKFAVRLFEDEYKVPVPAPAVAARIAMINELTSSTLLFLGLATRVVTLPLLGMTSVIEIFVYPNAWPDQCCGDPCWFSCWRVGRADSR